MAPGRLAVLSLSTQILGEIKKTNGIREKEESHSPGRNRIRGCSERFVISHTIKKRKRNAEAPCQGAWTVHARGRAATARPAGGREGPTWVPWVP